MNATADLVRLLAKWRRLSECEEQAILGDDWKDVTAQQDRKARLREEISRVNESVRTAQATQTQDGSSAGEKQHLAAVVSELIALEKHNHDLLSTKRREMRVELERLSETTHQLQGVRRAYGETTSHRWQSYS